MRLLKRATRIDTKAIVAQRLKRFPSIRLKLVRNRDMKLSQMQDIAGARAIVRGTQQLKRLVKVFEVADAKSDKDVSGFLRKYDYVSTPKSDGYRSVHLVYKYVTQSERYSPYDKMRVELQLRTRLQHAWATAVEAAGTFTGQALKSNIGDEKWKRFFALMGTAIARRERAPLVPGTPETAAELAEEIEELNSTLQVQLTLSGWQYVLDKATTDTQNAVVYLVELDAQQLRLTVRGYPAEARAQAEMDYKNIEEATGDTDVQAVLVAAGSLQNLRRAYPNYYLDTRAFLQEVTKAIEKKD